MSEDELKALRARLAEVEAERDEITAAWSAKLTEAYAKFNAERARADDAHVRERGLVVALETAEVVLEAIVDENDGGDEDARLALAEIRTALTSTLTPPPPMCEGETWSDFIARLRRGSHDAAIRAADYLERIGQGT